MCSFSFFIMCTCSALLTLNIFHSLLQHERVYIMFQGTQRHSTDVVHTLWTEDVLGKREEM